jgi:hypothetical protein
MKKKPSYSPPRLRGGVRGGVLFSSQAGTYNKGIRCITLSRSLAEADN